MHTVEGSRAPAVAPRYLEAAGLDAAALRSSETRLARFLAGLPGVDQVGCDARAAALATATRSG